MVWPRLIRPAWIVRASLSCTKGSVQRVSSSGSSRWRRQARALLPPLAIAAQLAWEAAPKAAACKAAACLGCAAVPQLHQRLCNRRQV